MKVLLCSVMIASLFAEQELEQRVLQRVQEMMQANQGRVTFSELHNDSRFSPDEKAFLGRLYEVFFEIPSYLKSGFEDSGQVPTRREIASRFDISPGSVELLLKVMESDRRMPPLFSRDSGSGEIETLNVPNIDTFIQNRGGRVRITQWEGQKMPSFELVDFNGNSWSSDRLKGSPALLYFWFTGCPPCVRIAPILAELEKKYRQSGFRFLGLNADNILGITMDNEQRKSYVAKSGTEYPNVHLDEATRHSFGNINVYPTLFFVDTDGTIAEHLLNFQDKGTLEKTIEKMLAD